jgi:hypothetical protein
MMAEHYDVVVAGGGPAGISAALAAARNGARTLLIEKHSFVGGVAASGIPLINFHNRHREQIIKGIAEELIERLKEVRGTTGHLFTTRGHLYSVTFVDPEWVKIIAEEMLLEAGVDLLLHSFVFGANTEEGQLKTIEVANKAGRQVISADCFIDATGDGDVAAFAGVPFEKGRASDGLMQAMTLVFRLVGTDLETLGERWTEAPVFGKPVDSDKVCNLHVSGRMSEWDHVLQDMDLFKHKGHNLWAGTLRTGELTYVNTTRISELDATDPRQLTQAEVEGRRQLKKLVAFFEEHVPGFERAYLASIAPQIGIRETRRIVGEYVLTAEDVLRGVKFEDRVAKNGYCIDIHDPKGKAWDVQFIQSEDATYDIPYRCLLPKGLDGLLVAGRCISATHEALGSVRIMPCCMALGQAAGTAAALAVKQSTAPRDIDIKLLQDQLRRDNAIL